MRRCAAQFAHHCRGAAIANHPDRDGCTEYKQRIWQEIERNPRLETIILAGRWPYQIIGTEPESGGANRTYLIDDATLRASIDESRRVFERSLERTLVRLHKLGRRVVIIGSIPEPGYDAPRNVAAALHFGRPAAAGISRDVVQSRMTEADTLLATIAKRHPDVLFLPIWQTICGKDTCPVERGGVPIYYDDDHLSHRGATEVAGPALRQAAATARGLDP